MLQMIILGNYDIRLNSQLTVQWEKRVQGSIRELEKSNYWKGDALDETVILLRR